MPTQDAVVMLAPWPITGLCDTCLVPLVDDSCPRCNVWHADACASCGRRGYHDAECPENDDVRAQEAA